MKIEQLWDKYKGETAHIVGTGPTLRFMQAQGLWSRLDGKLAIGMNDSWRYGPVRYTVSVHPAVMREYYDLPDSERNKTTWIVKKKDGFGPVRGPTKRPFAIGYESKVCYAFKTNEPEDIDQFEYVRERVPNYLFLGRGVQTTAITLAAHMGCSHAILYGCDMASLGGDHHGHNSHIRFYGMPSDEAYTEYRHYTARVCELVYEHWGMTVSKEDPLLGCKFAEQEYERLCRQFRLNELEPSRDTSPIGDRPGPRHFGETPDFEPLIPAIQIFARKKKHENVSQSQIDAWSDLDRACETIQRTVKLNL